MTKLIKYIKDNNLKIFTCYQSPNNDLTKTDTIEYIETKSWHTKNISDKQIVKSFTDSSSVSLNTILPAAIRYIDYSNLMLVFESPPGYRTVSTSTAAKYQVRETNTKDLLIPVPWQVYVVYFSLKTSALRDVYFFYAKEPITDLNDHQLYEPPVFNLYANCRVCLPGQKFYTNKLSSKHSLVNITRSAVDSVWASSFNRDLYGTAGPQRLDNLMRNNKKILNHYGIYSLTVDNLFNAFSHMNIDDIMNFQFNKAANLNPFINATNTSITTILAMRGI